MRSESTKGINEGLASFALKLVGAKKDSENAAYKGNKYADLASVCDAIKDALPGSGLAYYQVAHEREKAAAIETIITHTSGEWLSCGIVAVPVDRASAHGFGSALTYARRYSLAAAFGVAPEDDDGNAANKAEPKLAKSVPADELSKQDADTVAFLTEIAGNVRSMIVRNNIAGAYDEIESHNLEIELKAALWALLDSKERSAIKAEKALRKQPKVD